MGWWPARCSTVSANSLTLRSELEIVMPNQTVRALKEAVKDLNFSSESDYPLHVVWLPTRGVNVEPSPAGLIDAGEIAGISADQVDCSRSLDDMFAAVAYSGDGDEEQGEAQVTQFWKIINGMKSVHVFAYRSKQPSQFVIYVVGCVDAGWAGFKTVSVET